MNRSSSSRSERQRLLERRANEQRRKKVKFLRCCCCCAVILTVLLAFSISSFAALLFFKCRYPSSLFPTIDLPYQQSICFFEKFGSVSLHSPSSSLLLSIQNPDNTLNYTIAGVKNSDGFPVQLTAVTVYNSTNGTTGVHQLAFDANRLRLIRLDDGVTFKVQYLSASNAVLVFYADEDLDVLIGALPSSSLSNQHEQLLGYSDHPSQTNWSLWDKFKHFFFSDGLSYHVEVNTKYDVATCREQPTVWLDINNRIADNTQAPALIRNQSFVPHHRLKLLGQSLGSLTADFKLQDGKVVGTTDTTCESVMSFAFAATCQQFGGINLEDVANLCKDFGVRYPGLKSRCPVAMNTWSTLCQDVVTWFPPIPSASRNSAASRCQLWNVQYDQSEPKTVDDNSVFVLPYTNDLRAGEFSTVYSEEYVQGLAHSNSVSFTIDSADYLPATLSQFTGVATVKFQSLSEQWNISLNFDSKLHAQMNIQGSATCLGGFDITCVDYVPSYATAYAGWKVVSAFTLTKSAKSGTYFKCNICDSKDARSTYPFSFTLYRSEQAATVFKLEFGETPVSIYDASPSRQAIISATLYSSK